MKLKKGTGNARLVAILGTLVIAGMVYAGNVVSQRLTKVILYDKVPTESECVDRFGLLSTSGLIDAGGSDVALTTNNTLKAMENYCSCGSPSETEDCVARRNPAFRQAVSQHRRELIEGKRTLGTCQDVSDQEGDTQACGLFFDVNSRAHVAVSGDDNWLVEYTPGSGLGTSRESEDSRPASNEALANTALLHACTRSLSFTHNGSSCPSCYNGNITGCTSVTAGKPGITPGEFCSVAKQIKQVNSSAHPCRDGGGLVLWNLVVREGLQSPWVSGDVDSMGTNTSKPYHCACSSVDHCSPCGGNNNAVLNSGTWSCPVALSKTPRRRH